MPDLRCYCCGKAKDVCDCTKYICAECGACEKCCQCPDPNGSDGNGEEI